MPKQKVLFLCAECGAEHTKWQGQCSACKTWNSLSESKASNQVPRGLQGELQQAVKLSEVAVKKLPRLNSGQTEFDRVLGGGLVPGSVVLISGNPGAGKSTLLTQVSSFMSETGPVLYVAGEESLAQVAIRASRLGLPVGNLDIVSETSCERLISIWRELTPNVVIVDSIQVMFTENSDSSPGGVNQVRESASMLIQQAKSSNTVLILVGHVTKEGSLAGPRTLEHMIDAFISLEGQSDSKFRLLRSIKNRFGPVNELGVFAMTEKGLREIKNPSSIFLSRSLQLKPGSVVVVIWEGTRPLLLEIQALVTPSLFATSKRTVVGWDASRLSMLLAVLESRCDLTFSNLDIYLSIASGIKTSDPAADLAVAAALISSKLNFPLDSKTVIFGEINLSGTIRESYNTEGRIKEAEKLGFTKALISKNAKTIAATKIEMKKINGLVDFISYLKTISEFNG